MINFDEVFVEQRSQSGTAINAPDFFDLPRGARRRRARGPEGGQRPEGSSRAGHQHQNGQENVSKAAAHGAQKGRALQH